MKDKYSYVETVYGSKPRTSPPDKVKTRVRVTDLSHFIRPYQTPKRNHKVIKKPPPPPRKYNPSFEYDLKAQFVGVKATGMSKIEIDKSLSNAIWDTPPARPVVGPVEDIMIGVSPIRRVASIIDLTNSPVPVIDLTDSDSYSMSPPINLFEFESPRSTTTDIYKVFPGVFDN